MSYTMDESHTSPNYTAAASVQAAFGYPRNIIGSTIHHWDEKYSGATWAGTMATLMNPYWNPGSRQVSAHYMVETGRAACLVSVADAAWHSGNARGNAQTVGFELNPDESDGTYQTAAEVLARVWLDWGIPHDLFPHNYWTGTACPGGYDLVRLRRMGEVEYAKLTGVKPAPKPPVKPAPKPPVPPVVKRKTYPVTDINWIVEKGDTLSEISRYYLGDASAGSIGRITAYNGMTAQTALKVGERIWIPGPLYWTVEAPDTYTTVAARYGLDPDYLARLNGDVNRWSTIYIGNTLIIKK